ncbi:MAG: glycosyltransferase family 4 protein [Tepidanaerobacteraceae bacterium]|jgi:glycosyltransferase involved in cell wall biosynthesis|nr:glycosyltransferase family 4 protein [Tepidanaerobacteraceae bacterium]
MDRIKILEFIRDAEGGMKKHVESILSGLDKDMFDIILVCPEGQYDRNSVKNKIKNLYEIGVGDRRNPWSMLKSLLNLIQIIKKEKVDIIHCHGIACCIMGTVAGILSGKRLIVTTIHNFPAVKETGIKQRLSNFLAGFCIKFNRQVIAVSSSLKDHVSKLWGISEGNIRVIYNGIDIKKIRNSANKGAYNSNESPDLIMPGLLSGMDKIDDTNNRSCIHKQIIILNIARLIASKGVDVFLKAAAVLTEKVACKEVSRVEIPQNPSQPVIQPLFLIAGDGPKKAMLKKMARQLGIEKNVEFLGFRNDIYELIDCSDIVVLSSRSEGLGISILEALALEKPVVATNVGGISEIVDHRKTGLLVPSDDPEALAEAMLYFINNPQEAKVMAEKGCRMVFEKFTIETMIDNLQELFLNLHRNTFIKTAR